MNKIKKKINNYKVVAVLIMVLVFFLNFSYAEDACAKPLNTAYDLITAFSWIASWIWIILSKFAWTLMTNSIVYGSFMNLDTFLWKMWQMCRTFANFALWFMFLIAIFKYILLPWKHWNTPVKTIKEVLIASVLVQLSRFLVMIVIDLSTITVSAVASFPAQVISSSESVQKPMNESLRKSELVSVYLGQWKCAVYNALWGSFADDKDESWIKEIECTAVPDFMKHLMDNVTPSPKNLSWPFMYLWLTVFKTKATMNKIAQTNTDCVERFTRIFINALFDAVLTILFSLALLFLVVILLFRLMYIWLFIVLSPIIILLHFTSLKNYIWNNDLFSALKISSVLRLIFQPVIFALYISLMLLAVVTFQAFMMDGTPQAPWLAMDESKMNDGTYATKIDIWWNFSGLVQSWTRSVSQIFLSLLALAMIRYLVKLAVSQTKTWIRSIDGYIEDLSNIYTGLVTDVPLIPTPGWKISLDSITSWEAKRTYLKEDKFWKQIAAFTDFEGKRRREINDIAVQLWLATSTIYPLSNIQMWDLESASRQGGLAQGLVAKIGNVYNENNWIIWSDIKPYIIKWIERNRNNGSVYNSWISVLFGPNNPVTLPKEKLDENNFSTITNGDGWAYFYENVLKGTGKIRNYSDIMEEIEKPGS